MFPAPHNLPVWHAYLLKFLERYKGTNLERARELFEQAIEAVSDHCNKHKYITDSKCLTFVMYLLMIPVGLVLSPCFFLPLTVSMPLFLLVSSLSSLLFFLSFSFYLAAE